MQSSVFPENTLHSLRNMTPFLMRRDGNVCFILNYENKKRPLEPDVIALENNSLILDFN